MSIEDEILTLEDRLRAAMLASDVPVLDELLAPDLLFTNHLGHVLSKEDDLGAHSSGLLRLEELQPSEMRVLTLNEIAIVSVRVKVRGTYSGQPANGDFRFTRVWARVGSSRRVVAAHSGLVSGS